jgi:hypothetical protein
MVTGTTTDEAFANAVSVQSTCLLLMQAPASKAKSVLQAHSQFAGVLQPFAELNVMVTGAITEVAFAGALSVQFVCLLLMQEPDSSAKSVLQVHAQDVGTVQPFAEL